MHHVGHVKGSERASKQSAANHAVLQGEGCLILACGAADVASPSEGMVLQQKDTLHSEHSNAEEGAR